MPLDIGIGLIIGLLVNDFFDVNNYLAMAALGVILTLLPDLDFIVMKFKPAKYRQMERHRELFHLPLLYLSIGTLIFSVFGLPFVSLFILASVVHFIHDSVGIGWGVMWLYPFRSDSYSFIYQIDTWKHVDIGRKFVYIWPRRDITKLSERYGDKDWIRHTYGDFHPYAIIEFTVFFTGIIALLLYGYSR